MSDKLDAKLDEIDSAFLHEGGPGSGNIGHEGRPGHVGGSAPEGSTVGSTRKDIGKPSDLHGTISNLPNNKVDQRTGFAKAGSYAGGKIKIEQAYNRSRGNWRQELEVVGRGKYRLDTSVSASITDIYRLPIEDYLKGPDNSFDSPDEAYEWIENDTGFGKSGESAFDTIDSQFQVLEGQGRGNWGHAGRPGHVGGSSPSGGGSVSRGSAGPWDIVLDTGEDPFSQVVDITGGSGMKPFYLTRTHDPMVIKLNRGTGMVEAKTLKSATIDFETYEDPLSQFQRHFKWGEEFYARESPMGMFIVANQPITDELYDSQFGGLGEEVALNKIDSQFQVQEQRGNWGHEGRPGRVGGSAPSGSIESPPPGAQRDEDLETKRLDRASKFGFRFGEHKGLSLGNVTTFRSRASNNLIWSQDIQRPGFANASLRYIQYEREGKKSVEQRHPGWEPFRAQFQRKLGEVPIFKDVFTADEGYDWILAGKEY